MSYTNVAVRSKTGTLIISNGTAVTRDGEIAVSGSLQGGTSLTPGNNYDITGSEGLELKGAPYIGGPAGGPFKFKIP